MEKAKDRNNHPVVFCAIAVLNSFAKFTRKHLCLSFSLNKFTRRPKTKRLRTKFFSCDFWEKFQSSFFLEVWSDITSETVKYFEMFSSINLMKTDIYQIFFGSHWQSNIYWFKVNNRKSRERCEMCSKLSIKTPQRRQWRRFGVFVVKFEHISHLFLVLLLQLSTSKC